MSEENWEDANPIDMESEVIERKLYYANSKKFTYLNRIKDPFIRKVVSEYLGYDFFMCSKDTQKVLLDWAFQRWYEDEPKRKKAKWMIENYTLSEMINGRKARKGGRYNTERYKCRFCDLKFTKVYSLKRHLKEIHNHKDIDVKDLLIDKLKLELMKINAGRKNFLKLIDGLIRRSIDYQRRVDLRHFTNFINGNVKEKKSSYAYFYNFYNKLKVQNELQKVRVQ